MLAGTGIVPYSLLLAASALVPREPYCQEQANDVDVEHRRDPNPCMFVIVFTLLPICLMYI
jgi:hypothetical protein